MNGIQTECSIRSMRDTPIAQVGIRDGSLPMSQAGTSSNTTATVGAIMPISTCTAQVDIRCIQHIVIHMGRMIIQTSRIIT